MAERCFLYYITDRKAFAPDEPTRRRLLLDKITNAARAGVDYIQLREKDLTTRELEALAREVVGAVNRTRPPRAAVLINSRADIAIATGGDGVHLRSDDISPRNVKNIWTFSPESRHREPIIGVSCHSPTEVAQAEENGASFAVFAPVFEKKDSPGVAAAGLEQLRLACAAKIPVLALGGITLENARFCLEAGARGIAGIRLFQQNDVAEIVGQLRAG